VINVVPQPHDTDVQTGGLGPGGRTERHDPKPPSVVIEPETGAATLL
jgi:hypothetical protein